MEHWGKENLRHMEDGGRRKDYQRLGGASDISRADENSLSARAKTSRVTVTQDSIATRDRRSWVHWQSALYAFVLGTACVFLVPLTSLWWIVPVLGAGVPIALAVLDRPDLKPQGPEADKSKERELLHALAERGELTPTTAAMRTSLTVDEASKMLGEFARKGHVRSQAEDGLVSYALHGRDRHETPCKVSAPSGSESGRDGTPIWLGATQRLDEPLSERELEVLSLLASGKTNSEVAGDLFISVGTVKSHTGNIYRKLDAKNRAQALTRARDLELLR